MAHLNLSTIRLKCTYIRTVAVLQKLNTSAQSLSRMSVYSVNYCRFPQVGVIWCNRRRAKLAVLLVFVSSLVVCIPNSINIDVRQLSEDDGEEHASFTDNATAPPLSENTTTLRQCWRVGFKVGSDVDRFIHSLNFPVIELTFCGHSRSSEITLSILTFCSNFGALTRTVSKIQPEILAKNVSRSQPQLLDPGAGRAAGTVPRSDGSQCAAGADDAHGRRATADDGEQRVDLPASPATAGD